MKIEPFEFQVNLIQLVVLVGLTFYFYYRYREVMHLAHNLFVWGMLSRVMMNIYWISMLAIDGNGSYGFTGCDASALSSFFIWGALFQIRWKLDLKKRESYTFMSIGSILFGIWNVFWWNIWSGHLVINLIYGCTLLWITWMIFSMLDRNMAISKRVKVLWSVLIMILVIFEIPMYYVGGFWYHFSDWLCATAWFGLCLLFAGCAFYDKEHRSTWLFAALIYSLYSQYLTDGIRYSFFMMIETMILISMCLSFHVNEFQEGL